MIQALVNGIWRSFDEEELQPGTDSFPKNTGLYETFRTIAPSLLRVHPGNVSFLFGEKNFIIPFEVNSSSSLPKSCLKTLQEKTDDTGR